MSALVGRKVTLTPTGAGTPIIGAQTKSIAFNNEAIDITSDDDSGWQTYLADDPAQRGLSMTIEGVLKDDALILLATEDGASLIAEYELEIFGMGTFTGDFHIGSFSLNAPYKEAVTFSCTVNSSGPLAYVSATS